MDRHVGSSDGEGGSRSEPLVRKRFDYSETPPSLAVVLALSELGADHPIGIDDAASAHLAEYVDPEALDALYPAQSGRAPRVALTIEGYEVRVTDGEVVVRDIP